MRTIAKGPEPDSLTRHREELYSDYENYREKNDLRRALFIEQRGLCCYCMGSIKPERTSMKIEHWKSRSECSARELDYSNLLGACRGGEGQPRRAQYCDTRKGNRDLMWNPANPVHDIETHILYEFNGKIYSSDTKFNSQLEEVLNLNLAILVNGRKAAIDGILDWCELEMGRSGGSVSSKSLLSYRDELADGDGELPQYWQAQVWWLERFAEENTA